MAISESKTRLATVSYGSVVGSSSTYLLGDRMILGSSVMSMTKVGGSNDVGRGIEMGRLLLNNNKRYEVPRISVVIYKNVSMPAMIEAQQHADKMVDDGIRVISIGIGSSVLSHLALSQELAYNFTSTKKLLSSFREIPKYICKGTSMFYVYVTFFVCNNYFFNNWINNTRALSILFFTKCCFFSHPNTKSAIRGGIIFYYHVVYRWKANYQRLQRNSW